MSGQEAPPKPATKRATTSSKNRADSPPPYRSTAEVSIEDFVNELVSSPPSPSSPSSALLTLSCISRFWQHALNVAEHHEDDFKHQALPLARIKKVAKMDPEVQGQMISSEVTVLFEKACQIFIQEVTARAHLVSLAARRRTLSRADVAQAVSRSDMFDFLIDIVPRAERTAASSAPSASNAGASTSGSKRPSRTRKASQRQQEEEEAEAEDEYAESVGRAPHPLDPAPVGNGEEEDGHEPAAKRLRRDANGQQQEQQQQTGFYHLPPAFPGAAEAGASAAGGEAGQMPGYPQPGLPQWSQPGFDYAAASADPNLAAFYAAAAAGAHAQQQQQRQHHVPQQHSAAAAPPQHGGHAPTNGTGGERGPHE
ncbi:hypothetical protein JCM11251_005947 [Rhodosporidiobolus azoricus]